MSTRVSATSPPSPNVFWNQFQASALDPDPGPADCTDSAWVSAHGRRERSAGRNSPGNKRDGIVGGRVPPPSDRAGLRPSHPGACTSITSRFRANPSTRTNNPDTHSWNSRGCHGCLDPTDQGTKFGVNCRSLQSLSNKNIVRRRHTPRGPARNVGVMSNACKITNGILSRRDQVPTRGHPTACKKLRDQCTAAQHDFRHFWVGT